MRTKYLFQFTFFLLAISSCHSSKSIKSRVTNNTEIKFLSDSIKIYSILENYQKIGYDNSKGSYKWTNSKEQVDILVSLFKKNGLYNGKGKKHIKDNVLNVVLPTRYEDPIAYWILKEVKDDVEYEIKLKTGNDYKIGIGTLPYWTLNAKTYNNADFKERLIVVNSGLFNFCNELIKILLETINIERKGNQIIFDYSEKYFTDKLKENPALIIRFSKALENYSLNRTIRGVAPPGELQKLFLSEIENSIEFYALAHEYGHLYFNHNPVGSSALLLRNSENSKINSMDIVNNDWKQEIEADMFATLILSNYIERKKVANGDNIDFYPILRNSPSLFFKLSEIANSAKYIYQDKTRIPEISNELRLNQLTLSSNLIADILKSREVFQSEKIFNLGLLNQVEFKDTMYILATHPPDNSRAAYLNKFLTKKEYDSDEERQFQDLSNQMEKNLITMWDYLRPILYKIIEEDNKK